MNYALLAALKESGSTRQGKAEAKELLRDLSAFFSLGEEGDSTYGLLAATSEVK